MGFLERVFGSNPAKNDERRSPARAADADDEQAIARYRYLLRTAPPEAIEQAHAEAFSQLTPEQRTEVLHQLSAELPANERAGSPQQADPQALARMATRAELRQPGMLERLLGARGVGPAGLAAGGMGLGGMMAGSLFSSIAGSFIGSAIAHQFLGGFDGTHDESSSSHGLHDHVQHADARSDDAWSSDDGLDPDDDYGGGGDFGGDDFDV